MSGSSRGDDEEPEAGRLRDDSTRRVLILSLATVTLGAGLPVVGVASATTPPGVGAS